jgi:hypothetical protein
VSERGAVGKVLERNERLSEANKVVRRDVRAAVAEESAKVNQDLTNLARELAILKEVIGMMKPQAEPLVPPAAEAAAPREGHRAARHPQTELSHRRRPSRNQQSSSLG